MKGKKISKGKLIFLIVMLVVLVAVIMYDYFFLAKSKLPEYCKRYESYYSYRGKIEEIWAWSIDMESDDIANYRRVDTAYISNDLDTIIMGPGPDDIWIKVVGDEGERLFLLDKNAFIYEGIRDEHNGYKLNIGDRIDLAYFLENEVPHAVAIKCDMRGDRLTVLLALATLFYLILVIIFWPVYDTDKGTAPGCLALGIMGVVALAVIMFFAYAGYTEYMARARNAAQSVHAHAPVIYLYDDSGRDVNIKLDIRGELTETYPLYDERSGWNVTASPDGTLTDPNGDTYRFLYWEAVLDMDYDLSRGFCVRGCDTEAFLDEALSELGLNETEVADFKSYWLQFMEENPYNVITFQTTAYTDAAGLDVTPSPDVTVRINMLYYPSSEYVVMEPQDLAGMNPSLEDRSGFTLVEWGGEVIRPEQ